MDTSNAEQLFGELMDDNAKISKHARDQALNLLELANTVEENAAKVADKMREAAAALIQEAHNYAAMTSEILKAEFPLEDIGE